MPDIRKRQKRRAAHVARNIQALDALGAFTSDEHAEKGEHTCRAYGRQNFAGAPFKPGVGALQEVDQRKAEQKPVDE